MSDTTLNAFLGELDTAGLAGFTPVPPTPATGPDPLYLIRNTDDNSLNYWTGAAWAVLIGGGGAASALPSTIEGRLTTESGVPVSTSDRTAQGTLYYTPCTSSGVAQTAGNITLWSGATLVNVAFTELSLALTLTSGKNYDVFIDYNGGAPQIVLSAAWSNDTTRTDALGVQSGLIIKSGTATYRWVGTIRASGANVVADSGGLAGTSQTGGQRYVWNAFNQVSRPMNVIDTTNSWSYTTATIRQANGATGNKVEYVTGFAGTMIDARVVGVANISTTSSNAGVGIGVDSTTVFSGQRGEIYNAGGFSLNLTAVGFYRGYPGLGYHAIAWLEIGGGGSTTFVGDDGSTVAQTGLSAELFC